MYDINIRNAKKFRNEVTDMMQEAKEARRKYQAEWRRKNPDKVKAAQERYWERKAKKSAVKTSTA